MNFGLILTIIGAVLLVLLVLFNLFLLLLLALLFFAILPGKKRDAEPFISTLYAHRGLHSNDSQYPENSLIAFRLARQAGYGVEMDVQFTKDKQIVVFHDDDLKRMCGVDRRVDELTYEELKELRLLDSDQRIPLLTEALEVLDGATVLCELKTLPAYNDTSLCEAVYPILQEYKGAYCVESFNPLLMHWFKKNAPEVIRGILSKRFDEKNMPKVLRFALSSLFANFLCRPDFISYQHTDSNRFFFRLCRMFHPATFAWTVRNPGEETSARALFDTVIFEGYLPLK